MSFVVRHCKVELQSKKHSIINHLLSTNIRLNPIKNGYKHKNQIIKKINFYRYFCMYIRIKIKNEECN